MKWDYHQKDHDRHTHDPSHQPKWQIHDEDAQKGRELDESQVEDPARRPKDCLPSSGVPCKVASHDRSEAQEHRFGDWKNQLFPLLKSQQCTAHTKACHEQKQGEHRQRAQSDGFRFRAVLARQPDRHDTDDGVKERQDENEDDAHEVASEKPVLGN